MIERNTIVTLEYSVADVDGNVIDEGLETIDYLHGGYEDIYRSLEEALDGKEVGDRVMVKLQPGETFGEYDPELVQIADVRDLPQPLAVGMEIETGIADDGSAHFVRVADIAAGKAVLDGNHPLAGIALIVSCTVAGVRRASSGEIAERKQGGGGGFAFGTRRDGGGTTGSLQ